MVRNFSLDKGIGLNFTVVTYGDEEKINDVLTKKRVRIFYKYENRNRTYITDEFAEELISTLPYTPVKGIYAEDDYTDHGRTNSLGRIYGIVPENPNVAWEDHLDEDGIARTYACADVYLFTGLYKEAAEISNKGQSMELYPPSIEYHESIIKGQKYIVFDKGSFFGLQVLGDEVEPCFEGASFYTLQENIESVLKQIQNYTEGGNKVMPQDKFRLSDDAKFNALWDLLNPNFNEEGNWELEYRIGDVYDDYALCYGCGDKRGKCYRAYYTKDDDKDMVTIDNIETVYIMDVTEKEKTTLETLRELNGGTYELVSETLENAADVAEKFAAAEAKIVELETEFTTLKTEAEEAATIFTELQDKYNALEADKAEADAQIAELTSYKKTVEDKEKEEIISQYMNQLSETIIEEYQSKLDEFTTIELDKELAYELKKANPSAFQYQAPILPKDEEQLEGIDAVLARYRDKK